MRTAPRTSRSAADFLEDSAAATLVPKVRRLVDLRTDLSTLLPAAFGGGCDATSCENGVLELRAASAGAAAKLRQTLPRIRAGLLARGWEVNAIRIRVQPSGVPQERGGRPVVGPSMSTEGVAAFSALAGTLEDSPLRAAVDRLVARRRG